MYRMLYKIVNGYDITSKLTNQIRSRALYRKYLWRFAKQRTVQLWEQFNFPVLMKLVEDGRLCTDA